jgi:hypothetical protein
MLENISNISQYLTPKEIANREALLELHNSDITHGIFPTFYSKGREFHLFPKLPIEIRDMILELFLPGPRTITISKRSYKRAKSGPVPKLLQICQESRAFAERHYRLTLGSQLRGRVIYMDGKRDLLYISHDSAMSTLYGLPRVRTESDALRRMEDVEANVCASELGTLHAWSRRADPRLFQIRRHGVDTACLNSMDLGRIARFHNLDVLRVTSIYQDPSDRLKPYSEKSLIKKWKKNAKSGGWEVKIPKVDPGPAFIGQRPVPMRDVVG